MVQDMENQVRNIWDQNIFLPELENQDEVDVQCANLLEILAEVSPIKNVEDYFVWFLDENGIFSIKSRYIYLIKFGNTIRLEVETLNVL